jgi:photosystem II stability/assembly factor-like uncharacterized protein
MKKIIIFTPIIFVITILTVWHYNSNRPQHEERISGAYKALNFFSEQRAYPNNSIPDISHYAAYEKVLEKRNAPKELIFNTHPWETIGPHNTGGRTLAIAFNPQNPNTIYAGSASGGLWRSKTAGVGVVAWEYVHTGFPLLGVCSIDFAPGDSNIIYLGTGEVYNYQQAGTGAAYRSTRGSYGIGILKSVDGGQTWIKSLDWSYHQRRGVQVVRVNPLNPQTVWAGTTEGTYRSTDGGQSWQPVHNVIMVWDLVINPADTNIVLVTCGNFSSTGYGMYRTTNSGTNWNKITQGVPTVYAGKGHLAISRSHPDVMYASFGDGFSSGSISWLCKSSDKGATWTILSTVDYAKWQGWFSHDVGVSPVDTNLVIAIGIGVWKSTNGGITLVNKAAGSLVYGREPIGGPVGTPDYVHADNHDIVFHPTDPNIFYLGTDGGVFRSMDAGETFESRNGSYQTAQFYNGFSSSPLDSHLSLGGLQDNSTIIYDGQLAWIRVIGGDGAWTGVNSLNDNILYGSSQVLNLSKSTNRGQNWFSASVPFSSPTSFIAPYVVAYDNPQILYAGREKVYKSSNGGSSWVATNNGQALDGNPSIAMAISPQNNNVVYLATAPFSSPRGVFRTIDGGSSWVNITGNLPDRYPADLYVNPINEATAYITFSGYGSPHVYATTDYGSSWQDISSSLPDVPTSAVIVDPLFPDHIYIGNDIGIFVSVDAGNSWTEYNDGLPEAVMVFDLSISPTNRKLRVATHGNGAYQRDLIGETVNITRHEPILEHYQLFQNYPNPFNPNTTIPYSIAKRAEVTLIIYNSLGQKMRTLVNAIQPAGEHETFWDGTNDQGVKVSSGVYFYRLNVAGLTKIKMMSLTR